MWVHSNIKSAIILVFYSEVKSENTRGISSMENDAAKQYLDTLIQTIPDIIFFKDKDGYYVKVNTAFQNLIGLTEEEIVGKTDNQIFPAELSMQFLDNDKKVRNSRTSLCFEERFTRVDNENICFETIRSPMYDDSGNFTGITGIIRDITGAKQLEEDLVFLGNLMNQTNDAICVIEPESGRFLYVNEKMCSNLGYSREELLRMKVIDTSETITDRFTWGTHVKKVKEQGHMIFEGSQKRKDNTTLPVEVNVKFITMNNKQYLIAIVRDFTLHKHYENELEFLKEFNENIVETIPVCVFTIDTDFILRSWNNCMENFTSLGKEQALGKNIFEIFTGVIQTGWDNIYRKVMESGEPFELRGHKHIGNYGTNKGNTLYLNIKIIPMRKNEVITGALTVLEDITESFLSEEKYRTIIRNALDGFWIVDIEGRILDINNSVCALLGYSRNELLSMGVAEIEAMETPEDTIQRVKKVKEIGFECFETRHRRKDGTIVDIEVSANFLDYRGGMFFSFLRQITGRKNGDNRIIREFQPEVSDGLVI